MFLVLFYLALFYEVMYKGTTTAWLFKRKNSGCPGKEDILMTNTLPVLPKSHIILDSAATNIIKHYSHSNVLGSQYKKNKIHITSMYMCKSPKVSRNCFFILAIKWGQKSLKGYEWLWQRCQNQPQFRSALLHKLLFLLLFVPFHSA